MKSSSLIPLPSSKTRELTVDVIHISNPLDPYKGLKRTKTCHGITIWQYLDEEFGPAFKDFKRPTICILNGSPVMRADWNRRLLKGDVLTFACVAGYELLYYVIVAIVVALAVVLVMENPALPGNQKQPETVYNLSGQKNALKINEPIEVPYGRVRHYPSYGAMVYTQYYGNQQFNYALHVIGQGYYDIHSVNIEDTPIGNFQEAEYQIVPPGGQVTLFPDNVITSVEVSNIQLFGPNQNEYQGKSGPYIANPVGTLANYLEFDVNYPEGLFGQHEGDMIRMLVQFEFEYQEINDSGDPLGAWTSFGVEEHFKVTITPQRFSIRYEVPEGRYQVRGARINPKNMNAGAHTTLMWEALRAFLPSTKEYGNVTMLAVKIRASNNVNNNSQQRINVDCTRKLPVWHPETGWSDPVATRSIAWAFADAFRNVDYGIALEDQYIDLEGLYELDQVWTARNEFFDYVFDGALTVREVAKTIARTGRAIFAEWGSKVGMIRDYPREAVAGVFTPDNIVAGSFKITYKHFEPDAIDHVIISYKDQATWLDEEVTCVWPGYTTLNPERVTFAGCTDRNHAFHEGQYILGNYLHVRDSVQFTTGMEGYIPTYGDKIKVYHDVPQEGISSGFVLAIDGFELVLDRDVTFLGGPDQHVVTLRKKDGSGAGPFLCSPVVGNKRRLLLDEEPDVSDFSFSPYNEPPCFIFGTVTNECLILKVTSVEHSGSDGLVDITAVNYTEEIYEYDEVDAPVLELPNLPPVIPKLPIVTGLKVVLAPDNINLVVSWNPAPGARLYVLQQSDNEVEWDDVVSQVGLSYTLPIFAGDLYLRVCGINSGAGPWTYTDDSVGYPIHPPADPSGVSWSWLNSMIIQWAPTPGALSYKLRVLDQFMTELRAEDPYEDVSFEYTEAMAITDGLVGRDLNIEIIGVNDRGDSDPTVQLVSNPVPTVPVPESVFITGDNYNLRADQAGQNGDSKFYRFYLSSVNGFTPDGSNKIYDGNLRTIVTNITATRPMYWRVSCQDKWGPEEIMSAQQVIP